VIALPPLSGAVHLTSTLLPSNEVVGATGIAGIYAAKTLSVLDGSERPYEFLAYTLKA